MAVCVSLHPPCRFVWNMIEYRTFLAVEKPMKLSQLKTKGKKGMKGFSFVLLSDRNKKQVYSIFTEGLCLLGGSVS